MHIIAVLTQNEMSSLELLINKSICAKQALRPDAVPPYAPAAAKDKFFREVIFAYADVRYLQQRFWRDLAKQHGIATEDISKMHVDFDTNELSLKGA